MVGGLPSEHWASVCWSIHCCSIPPLLRAQIEEMGKVQVGKQLHRVRHLMAASSHTLWLLETLVPAD